MKMNTHAQVKPFLKWAGGKSQLLESLREKYPTKLNSGIKKYCEPFVGGGAVLFDILSRYPDIEEILINDINPELMNTYTQIKDNVFQLIAALENLQEQYWKLEEVAKKNFYYERRDRFNFLKINADESFNIEKASLFIFLNKTCFNGLYRVNRQGLFNVPMGAYKKPIICDKENLQNISMLLDKVSIKHGDYKDTLPFIDSQTFVYIDPPYRPLTSTASFTSYVATPFSDKEQLELGLFVDQLHAMGAKVVLSNSDPKNADSHDEFFDDLYKNYNIVRILAKRMINCNGGSRGDINELLISNF